MIGILVADSNEINDFPWNVIDEKKINQFEFTRFDNGIVAVHSGIGIANAAAATQMLISVFGVEKIFNYGAVGGIFPAKLFDVVMPDKITYHDVTTPWYKRGQTPGEEQFFPNSLEGELTYNLGSGSSFLTDLDELQSTSKELNTFIYDMEGAAIAQIAFKNNVPLYMIKVVSDVIGLEDESLININDRIKEAGKIAFDKIVEEVEKHL